MSRFWSTPPVAENQSEFVGYNQSGTMRTHELRGGAVAGKPEIAQRGG